MLLIKIFEWHGIGQEAITYMNNEVSNNVGIDRIIVYLYRRTKVHLYVIRDDASINLWNTFNLSSINFRSAVLICINIIYHYKRKGSDANREGMHGNAYDQLASYSSALVMKIFKQ